jgi:hypothetical protein
LSKYVKNKHILISQGYVMTSINSVSSAAQLPRIEAVAAQAISSIDQVQPDSRIAIRKQDFDPTTPEAKQLQQDATMLQIKKLPPRKENF